MLTPVNFLECSGNSEAIRMPFGGVDSYNTVVQTRCDIDPAGECARVRVYCVRLPACVKVIVASDV